MLSVPLQILPDLLSSSSTFVHLCTMYICTQMYIVHFLHSSDLSFVVWFLALGVTDVTESIGNNDSVEPLMHYTMKEL